MRKFVILMITLFAPLSYSWDIGFSKGVGVKYGGMIGGQLLATDGKHNVRGSLAFFGYGLGYDYKVFNQASIGATTGSYASVVSASDIHTLNFTYHPSGKYTSGWNISLDVGRSKCTESCFGDFDYQSYTLVSIGHTLKFVF